MKKKKVAIVTWHYYSNFGSALQAFALQEQLKMLGCRSTLLDYRNLKYGKISALKEHLIYVLGKFFPTRFDYPFIKFRKEHLKLSRLEQNEKKLSAMVNSFDAVICGSDQIWAPNVLNPIYLLEFVPDHIPKISYAASIGLNDIPEKMIDIYKRTLSRFVCLSVREKAAEELLSEKCEIETQTVLDPTFLVNASKWRELCSPVPVNKGKYIFCYFLNKDHLYQKAICKYAEANGLEIIGCSANPNDTSWMKQPSQKIGPREFLWLVINSECIFTDSYHGTIFSLLFHKKFITFERFLETDSICQNSRIHQLAEDFSIKRHIVRVTNETELEIPDYDYEIFERRLMVLRKNAVDYLNKALECC